MTTIVESVTNKVLTNDILSSIQYIKTTVNELANKKTEITQNSRINEQELFAAITKSAMSKVSKDAESFFKEHFGNLLKETKETRAENFVFAGIRRLLKKAVQEGIIPSIIAREIRHFAYDKAQLDEIKGKLSLTKEDKESKDTAVRTVNTALKKFESNEVRAVGENPDLKSYIKGIDKFYRKDR